MIKRVAFISLIFVFMSCGKQLDDMQSDFFGVWKGEADGVSYTLRLDEEGNGRYAWVGNEDMKNIEGRARIKEDVLHISIRSFKINRFPFMEEGFYYMEMEGVTLKRFDFE